MYKKLLIIVFVLGLVLRVVSLDQHPSGFTPDEASFGYDAYSILKTSKDQWGNVLPLNLKSFGDYKLPVYSYLAIPFIALLDLSVVSTRLPNAILGSLAILVLFFLVKAIFKNKRLALVSAFFLAISPWHIALSRGAFEANLTSFFLPLALYFIYKGIKSDNKNKLLIGGLLIGINLFTYHTARLLTIPVLIMFLILIFKKQIFSINKYFWLIIIFFIGLTGYAMLSGGGGRIATSSLFSISSDIYNVRFPQLLAGEPLIFNRIFNNKITFIAQRFTGNYMSYLSPQFLFTQGALEHTYGMRVGVGVLYLFEIFTLITALFYGVFRKINKNILFFLLWVVLAPIPAALSIGPGHAANRAAFMMPAIQVISAFGFLIIYDFLNKKFSLKIINIILAVIILISFSFSFESYWYGQKAHGARDMLASGEELVNYVSQVDDQYERVVVTKSLSEGHMFFAFFQKLSPVEMQEYTSSWNFEEMGLSWVDQQPEYLMGKITFRDIDWQVERNIANTLVIGKWEDFPEDVVPIHTIYHLDGDIAYVFVDTRTKAFASLN